MRILKYKKESKGKYKVFLENGVSISFYEEVILKYELLLKRELDEETLIEADMYNQECDVYYAALNNIQRRFRSINELKELLIRKEYPLEYIDKAISKLIKQGYLNDSSFVKSYVNNQMITTNKGPFKIEKELLEKKIDSDIVKHGLLQFTDEEQVERINKIITRLIRSNHSRGGIVLKQKIFTDLKKLGYDISIINEVLSNFDFKVDSEIAKREYDKLYRKYSRKYSGYELANIIREKLYLKGLKYEEEWEE